MIPAPDGGAWGFSTILGNARRETGLLRNALYVGRLVWNRQRYVKDPDTGKRISRVNPRSEWITQQVPELSIVDDELWQAVQDRLDAISKRRGSNGENRFWEHQRGGICSPACASAGAAAAGSAW